VQGCAPDPAETCNSAVEADDPVTADLTDTEAEVAAHAAARPGEPAGETESGPVEDGRTPDSADVDARHDQGEVTETADGDDSPASTEAG
jgi:hypothetical protein